MRKQDPHYYQLLQWRLEIGKYIQEAGACEWVGVTLRRNQILNRSPSGLDFGEKSRKRLTQRKNKKRTCFVYSYDENEYMQNFDEGSEMGNTDLLCRSFSARYANPIRKDMMV